MASSFGLWVLQRLEDTAFTSKLKSRPTGATFLFFFYREAV
jgi:hypothetical protein